MTLQSSLTIVAPRGSLTVCYVSPVPYSFHFLRSSSQLSVSYYLILGSRGPRNPWSPAPGTQGMTRRQSGRRGYLELTLNSSF